MTVSWKKFGIELALQLHVILRKTSFKIESMSDSKIHHLLVVFFALVLFSGFKPDKPAYLIYNKEGKKVKYKKVVNEMKKADVVFFGEQHANPISHWLQYEVAIDLYDTKRNNLILGAEMFETDDQLVIDEYFDDLISEQRFESEVKLWNNYKTDYEPLVDFAKAHNLSLVATNIPRRYASVVYQQGFEGLEALPEKAKEYIAPLPINYDPNLPSYKKMVTMDHIHRSDGAVDFFPQAQAVKDATMAWRIHKNYEKGDLFFHINGAYHSDNYEGIVWHLRKYRENINIITITTVEQKDVETLEDDHMGRADFIIVVPATMTRTH